MRCLRDGGVWEECAGRGKLCGGRGVGAGIVKCLEGWRCMVRGVEVCGRGGGVWW